MEKETAHLEKTLNDFKQQYATKLADTRNLLAAMNMLEEMLRIPKTPPPDFRLGISVQETVPLGNSVSVTVTPSRPAMNEILPDEYLGQTPLEAAKKFLRRVRRAANLDEIADAIRSGGAAASGADWKEQLDESLLRSTRDVVKVQEGIYGLSEFYTEEQLKGLRGTRRQRPKTEGKKRRRGRPKKKTGKGKIAVTKKELVPTDLTAPRPTPKKRGRPPKRQDQQPRAGEEKAE